MKKLRLRRWGDFTVLEKIVKLILIGYAFLMGLVFVGFGFGVGVDTYSECCYYSHVPPRGHDKCFFKLKEKKSLQLPKLK